MHCDNGWLHGFSSWRLWETRVSFCSHALQRQYSHKIKGSKSLSITPEQLIPNQLFYALLQPHPVHYQQLPLWRCALMQNPNHPDTGHIMFISYAHQCKQGSRAACEWKLGIFLHLNGHLKWDLGINQWLWKKYDELWRYVLLLYIKLELGDV